MSQNQTPFIPVGRYDVLIDFSDDGGKEFRSVGGLYLDTSGTFWCIPVDRPTSSGFLATLQTECLIDRTIVHTIKQVHGDGRKFLIRQIWDSELERHNFANFWDSSWQRGSYPKPIVQYDGISPLLMWLSQRVRTTGK